jgi:hypothetical protein
MADIRQVEITFALVTQGNHGAPYREMMKRTTADVASGYACTDCEWVSDELGDADDPTYECSCGETFKKSESENDSHKCSCGKFASKLHEWSCPECGEEVEETDVVGCPACEEPVKLDAFVAHYTEGCAGK